MGCVLCVRHNGRNRDDRLDKRCVCSQYTGCSQRFLGKYRGRQSYHRLVVDGIIGGLGAVLGFVPQMAVLFLLLSFLEDCGYMVRIAFVMDRVFRHFGLSGKSSSLFLFPQGVEFRGLWLQGRSSRIMTEGLRS